MLVGWQDSSSSDGLVTDEDWLLVAGVGNHSEWIINIRTDSDTYNSGEHNIFFVDRFSCTTTTTFMPAMSELPAVE